jgi:hypothetical protein
VREWLGDATVAEKKKRSGPVPEDEREIEYLICRHCSSPCYVFHREKGNLIEAICEVCGNDDPLLFRITEDEDE